MDGQLLTYIAFTTMLVVTPGAATAVVVRNVLAAGPRAGLLAAAGVALANATYACAAAMGIAAVLTRIPAALIAIRVGGGLYLAWLGLNALRLAASSRASSASIPSLPEPAPARGSFVQGAVTNLLNPSIAVFYIVVVPSFVPAADGGARMALLASIQIAMAFAVHAAWVLGLSALQAFWSRPRARAVLEALTGFALLSLAFRVIFR